MRKRWFDFENLAIRILCVHKTHRRHCNAWKLLPACFPLSLFFSSFSQGNIVNSETPFDITFRPNNLRPTTRPRRIRLAEPRCLLSAHFHSSRNCVTCPVECYWLKMPILPLTTIDRTNRVRYSWALVPDTRSISTQVSLYSRKTCQYSSIFVAYNCKRNFIVIFY